MTSSKWYEPGADESASAISYTYDERGNILGEELYLDDALAELDKQQNGGNADGVIDSHDAVFSSLRLWRDANHDGVSQVSELRTLSESDVARIELDYKESKRVEAFGNRFRYRAKVMDAKGAKVGRWAWDVFLLSKP